MDHCWDKVEEIIELTGDNASYYFSQAMNGTIRIKGRFIRDENGKLRPVLVKTSYRPAIPYDVPASETRPWGVVPTQLSISPVPPPPAVKKSKWFTYLLNWLGKLKS